MKGDYFDEDDFEDEVEEEDAIEDKPIETIEDVKHRRDTILRSLKLMKTEFKESIGRLNLRLFGDVRKKELGDIDALNEELEHPLTKGHPLADRTRAVVDKIQRLQLGYAKLHKYYEEFIKEIGTLLDSTLDLYSKDMKDSRQTIGKYKDSVLDGPAFEENIGDDVITEKMVSGFMVAQGQKHLDNYFKAVSENNEKMMRATKGGFVGAVTQWFQNMHPDPRRLGRRMFLSLVKGTKKGGDISNKEPPSKNSKDAEPSSEQKSTQSKVLNETKVSDMGQNVQGGTSMSNTGHNVQDKTKPETKTSKNISEDTIID